MREKCRIALKRKKRKEKLFLQILAKKLPPQKICETKRRKEGKLCVQKPNIVTIWSGDLEARKICGFEKNLIFLNVE